MRYDVTIDGVSILTAYGAFIGDGGFRDIVRWPALKPVSGNDWQEVDGFEPDLSDIHLGASDITVNFICRGNASATGDFWAFLASEPVREYNISSIGYTANMRIVSMSSLDYAISFSKIVARLVIDKPFDGYTYQAPVSIGARTTGYKIDGTDLSAYGVIILKGTLGNILKEPDVKPLLVRDVSTFNGTVYDQNPLLWDGSSWERDDDTGEVTTAAQDLTLKCWLCAPTATFWRNYLALLHDLVKDSDFSSITLKGARVLSSLDRGQSVKCYYKSQSVSDFTLFDDGYALAKFDIVLRAFEPWYTDSDPYLEIRPEVIWVNPWGTNDVFSNTSWNIG